MVLFLSSVIVVAIFIAIPRVRHRIWFGGWTGLGIARGDFSITGESAEQSATPGPLKPFLVVVLPDGTIVTPAVAGQV
jgi:hypothetical protein